MQVSVKELRKNLAACLSRAESGEEIVVTRNDRPVARLSPLNVAPKFDLAAAKALREELGLTQAVSDNSVFEAREDYR